MPDNVLFDFEGRGATHQEAHNIYGLEMARASYDGARKAMNKRPFVLTRAGFAGLQRYTAIWTGDNQSEEDHMLLGVRLLNSFGLSGVPFTGMDVGGFAGTASPDLFARWMQIGAFNPYFRSHKALNSKSAEPWTFGEPVLEISRNYVNLRYKLMPYLYSSFYEATQNGQPIMRTLAIDYTFDSKVYNNTYQNQYFFGKSFMVAPFESDKDFGKVYFPKGKFYDLYTDTLITGGQEKVLQLSLQKLPVYLKESSIVPMQSLVQSTAEKPTDTLGIHLYNGDITNSFVYYEDDGESYDYEKGKFYKRTISFEPAKKTITFNKVEGSYLSKFKHIKIVLHGFSTSSLSLNGKLLSVKDDFVSFLVPLTKSNPENNRTDRTEGCKVKSLVINNDTDAFSLTY